MNNYLHTIEDCLEAIAGLSCDTSIEIEKSDKTIMYSIARQVYKGSALTDRQYALMKTKLAAYKDQFLENAFDNFDTALESLRLPLREIDRSKYIKIVSHAEMVGPNNVYESYKQDWKWIKVRFPFSKKDIMKINAIPKFSYEHDKGSHEHYFALNEKSIDSVCTQFINTQFEIDKELLNWYEEIKIIKSNPSKYVPGLWNDTLSNFPKKANVHFKNFSRLQLLDRKRQLGIEYITCDKDNTMENLIAQRSHPEICLDPKEYYLDEIIAGLKKLERFPLLVIISPENSLHELRSFVEAFEQHNFNTQKQTVLFRTRSSDDYNVNNYIKDKKLNNWLDSNTEVVYISKDKLPKLLFKNNWHPQAAISISSVRNNHKVQNYIDSVCDLIIYNDDSPSIFKNKWRLNGYV